MRSWPLLLTSFLIVGCGKGAGSSTPAIVAKVTVLKGKTPTKTIAPIAAEVESDMLRYELKQPFAQVVESVRKDAQTGGWKENSPMGHPGFVATTAETISNVDVEAGKLSADGLTLTPDPGTTVVTVSEVKTSGKPL